NPQHTTTNFNGWADANPNGYAIDCGTHDRFELYFVTHAIETSDVAPKLAKPVLRTDYFATAVDFIKASNAEVERLYQIDKAGGWDIFRKPISAEAKEFTAGRLAAGASLLRDYWWSAWVNSAKPAKRGVYPTD